MEIEDQEEVESETPPGGGVGPRGLTLGDVLGVKIWIILERNEIHMNPNSERVYAYVDGFNLYFGILSAFPQYKWLDVNALVSSLLKPNQVLIGVKYFTSRVSNNPPKEMRQQQYLNAIGTTPVQVVYGKYNSRQKNCPKCPYTWTHNEEKMTDVNIAVNMIVDAYQDAFDVAILVSGDSDLEPPVKAVQANFAPKRVIVAFPPKRHNVTMKNAAYAAFQIGRAKLAASQFPETINIAGGHALTKPIQWK